VRICVEKERTLTNLDAGDVGCGGEILNIVCVIVSNSSYKFETRIRKDKV
jgi:hypothetical protein